jgi:anti-sigma factor RsiW
VNCYEMNTVLHGYADGELDLVRSLEVERHLEGCAACSASLRLVRELRQSLRDDSLYHRAPAGLWRRVRTALPRSPRPRSALAGRAAGLLAVAASLAVFAFLTWVLVHQGMSQPVEDLLAQAVVKEHVRSLLVGQDPRVDVASSDQHEVKPWFNGRVPFAPVVRDLKDEGYALVGGRLDYLDNRKVAALVYKHRKHPINLFTWPSAGAADEAPRRQTRQGYHLVRWTQDGMTYWAVSDLNEEELLRFAELIRHGR